MGIALTLREVRESYKYFLNKEPNKGELLTDLLREVIQEVGIKKLNNWQKERLINQLTKGEEE